MGEKTNSSNPPIKSLPPSGKRAGQPLHAQFSPKRGRWVYMRDGVGGRDRSGGGVPSGRPAGGLQSGRGLWLSAGAQWVTSPPARGAGRELCQRAPSVQALRCPTA